MKTIFPLLVLLLPSASVLAQQATFDLITYTVPVNWAKETRENVVSYVSVDQQKSRGAGSVFIKVRSVKAILTGILKANGITLL
ncbi:hypothetical protein [Paraflavitalea speifideaquila]|uniref:hypothetical protein n=1 Tax=Paraflavitalea speifideaquila TaxID=3076558 RepID=UPI0028EF0929|nr:hypothetical protein [Paraflavitalea speifideiaquila]